MYIETLAEKLRKRLVEAAAQGKLKETLESAARDAGYALHVQDGKGIAELRAAIVSAPAEGYEAGFRDGLLTVIEAYEAGLDRWVHLGLIETEEYAEGRRWLEEHKKTCKLWKPSRLFGIAIGGAASWEIVGTSIGTLYNIHCACGERHLVNDP